MKGGCPAAALGSLRAWDCGVSLWKGHRDGVAAL